MWLQLCYCNSSDVIGQHKLTPNSKFMSSFLPIWFKLGRKRLFWFINWSEGERIQEFEIELGTWSLEADISQLIWRRLIKNFCLAASRFHNIYLQVRFYSLKSILLIMSLRIKKKTSYSLRRVTTRPMIYVNHRWAIQIFKDFCTADMIMKV